MADPRTILGAVGNPGCGKSTLLRTASQRFRRVIIWDVKGEYSGPIVTLDDLPKTFKKKAFRVRYRPGHGALPHECDALLYVVRHLATDVVIVLDEIFLVCPNRREGEVGMLLRYARERRIGLLWATQLPTHLPSVLLAVTKTLHVFHLHATGSLQVLRQWLSPEQLETVKALPPHESLTINLGG